MTAKEGKSISFVLPAYNEEENIEKAVRAIVDVAEGLDLEDWEIIVVDDGSTDATGAIIDRLHQENPRIRPIHHESNLGYADALRTGFTSARCKLVFYTDSDLQFDVREVKNFLPAIEDYDIVTGFRIYRYDPLSRLILAWGYNLIARTIFRLKVRDIDCAFKLFRREVFDVIEIRSKKFFVDTEILAKARYHGFRMTEIGVRHYPRAGGRSTVRPSHVLSTLKELAKMWLEIYLGIGKKKSRHA
ncbi:MAG TPA: glycosyltransferase family 2 protein [Firmicutes bacterium]|nr:glycosyltransferase family 2 protein [Bacillota bacterium]